MMSIKQLQILCLSMTIIFKMTHAAKDSAAPEKIQDNDVSLQDFIENGNYEGFSIKFVDEYADSDEPHKTGGYFRFSDAEGYVESGGVDADLQVEFTWNGKIELQQIYIPTEWRGKGIFKHVLALVANYGVKYYKSTGIKLTTSHSTESMYPPQFIYKHLGFRTDKNEFFKERGRGMFYFGDLFKSYEQASEIPNEYFEELSKFLKQQGKYESEKYTRLNDLAEDLYDFCEKKNSSVEECPKLKEKYPELDMDLEFEMKDNCTIMEPKWISRSLKKNRIAVRQYPVPESS